MAWNRRVTRTRAPAPFRRAILRLSLGLCAAALVLAAAAFAARHEIADRSIRSALAGTPLAEAAWTVSEAAPDRIALTDIVLAGFGSVERAELDHRWGRVESARVSGADLPFHLDRGAEDAVGRWAELLRSLPVDELIVADADIAVVHPLGAARIAFEGVFRPRGPAAGGEGRWRAQDAFGRAEGEFAIGAGPGSGIVVIVADGEVAGWGIEADALAGRIEVASAPDAAGRPHARAALRAEAARIRGLDIGALTLAGAWDGYAAKADIEFGAGGATLAGSLAVEIDTKGRQWRSSATGAAVLREPAALPFANAVRLDAPARLEIALESVAAPDRPNAPLHGELTGQGVLETGSATLPGGVSIEGGTFAFDIASLDGRLALAAPSGATLRGLRLPSPASMDGIVRAALDRAFDLSIPPGGLFVDAAFDGEAPRFGANLAGSLTAGDGLEGEIRLRGGVEAEGGAIRSFDLEAFELLASGELAPGHAEGVLRLKGGARGAPSAFTGAADLQARLSALSTGALDAAAVTLDMPLAIRHTEGVTRALPEPVALMRADRASFFDAEAAGVVAELPLDIEIREGAFDLRLTDTAWIDVQALRHPRLRSYGATSVKLEAEMLPLLSAERFGDDWSWDARLKIGPTALRADLLGESGPFATLDGTLPSMGVRLGSLGRRHLRGTVETAGGDMRLEGPDLRLADFRILATYNNGLSEWPQVNADIRMLEDMRAPARFAPLAADFSVMPVWPLGDDVRFNGNLHMENRRFLVNVESSYRPDRDLLRVLLRVPPIRFLPGGSQPRDVSPLYGGLFEEARGAVGLHGEIVVAGGDLSSNLTLAFQDLSARSGSFAVEALDGAAILSDLDPVATPPGQRLTAARFEAGVALTDIAVVGGLSRDGGVTLEAASASLAGGRIALAPASEGDALLFDLQGVDGAALLRELGVSGLTVDTPLSGAVTLRLEAGRAVVQRARLEADAGGALRYAENGGFLLVDASISEAQGALALRSEALTLSYEALALAIDREDDGATSVRVTLEEAVWDSARSIPGPLDLTFVGDADAEAGVSALWRIGGDLLERISGE